MVGNFVSETGVVRGVARVYGRGLRMGSRGDSHEKVGCSAVPVRGVRRAVPSHPNPRLPHLQTLLRARDNIAELVDRMGVRPRDDTIAQAHRIYKIALEGNFTRGRKAEQVRYAVPASTVLPRLCQACDTVALKTQLPLPLDEATRAQHGLSPAGVGRLYLHRVPAGRQAVHADRLCGPDRRRCVPSRCRVFGADQAAAAGAPPRHLAAHGPFPVHSPVRLRQPRRRVLLWQQSPSTHREDPNRHPFFRSISGLRTASAWAAGCMPSRPPPSASCPR